MSSITFDPPIGRTVHVGISCASVRPTVLLFTAQLSRHDHDQLVKNGGRVQLWTDIPDEGHTNAEWRALDFVESSPAATHSGLVALHTESATELETPNYLYIMVCSPGRFQFTYRILYPSGAIVWLGQYGQNGLISLKETESPLTVDGLDINAGWKFSESRQAYVSEKIRAESFEVLRLRALADFRILALTEQGFLPSLENARMLFFIPRTQPSISIRPTYVLSSSPDLSMTVLADGRVSVSGSGTLMLAVHDFQRDPSCFIQDHIQNCGLGMWNVVPCNKGVPCVALASGGPNFPAEAAVIPLWPSEHTRIFKAPVTKIFETIGNCSFAEWAILSTDNSKVHLFNQGQRADSTEDLSLRFDLTHNQFKFSPLYQLRLSESSSPSAKKEVAWKAVVFTPHNVVQYPFAKGDHDPLPTPPPSPLLRPVAHLTKSRVSGDTVASSVDTLLSDIETPLGSRSNRKMNSEFQNPSYYSSSVRRTDSQTQTQRWPSPRTFLVTLVKSYLSALTALIKFFIYLWVIPFRQIWGLRRQIGRESASAAKSPGCKNPAFPESQDIPPQTQEDENENDPDSINMSVPEADVVSLLDESDQALANGSISSETLFIELHRDAEAIDSKCTTAMIAILVPYDKELSTEDVASSTSVGVFIASHAVRFVKGFSGFESSSPEYSVSRCEIVTRNEWQDEQERVGSCYLLSYNLVWDDGQKGKIICLSTPPL